MRQPVIYLDQRFWIGLSRALYGRTGSTEWGSALAAMQRVHEKRLALFPLSFGHYFETARRGDPESRERLARVMFRFSRDLRIAESAQLAEPEARFALHALFGQPSDRPDVPVLGRGIRHVFSSVADDRIDWEPPPDVPLSALLRQQLKQKFLQTVDLATLARMQSGDIGRPTTARAEKDAAGEREIAGNIRKWCAVDDGLSKSEKIRRMILTYELADLGDIMRDLTRQGLPSALLLKDGGKWAERCLRAMPAHWIKYRMRYLAHHNFEHRWEANDLIDLACSSAAAAYCDVVAIEKRWGDMLRRRGLGARTALVVDGPVGLTTFLERIGESTPS